MCCVIVRSESYIILDLGKKCTFCSHLNRSKLDPHVHILPKMVSSNILTRLLMTLFEQWPCSLHSSTPSGKMIYFIK